MYQVGWYGRICFGTGIISKWNWPIGKRTFWIICLEGWGPPLRNTRADSSMPASDPDNKRNLQLQPNARHVFSVCIRVFLPKTLALPVPVWPLKDFLRSPFYKTLPLPARVWPLDSLLRRTASRVLFFGRLQHCPFKRFRHSLTFGRLLSKPSCFLWQFIIVRYLQSFSHIVLWEQVVFCFIVASFSACNLLVLEWIIEHCFLFLCSISFCMYLFDNVSSSSVDKFASTALNLFRVLWPCQFLEGDTQSWLITSVTNQTSCP